MTENNDQRIMRNQRDATAYRDLMDSVDSSRFESQDATMTRLRVGLAEKLREGEDYVSADLDKETAQAINDARNIVSGALDAAQSTLTKTTAYLRDDTVWPGAKRDKAPEMIGNAVTALDTSATVARAAVDTALTELYAATRPNVADGEQETSRSDARMLLDGAGDGAAIMGRVTTYLENNGSDSVSALFADPRWLGLYLTGRGLDPKLTDAYSDQIRERTVKHALSSNDKGRQNAAKAITHVRAIGAGIDVLTNARNYVDPRATR